MTFVCNICAASGGHATYEVREQMFGWRDPFLYFQCNNCGCLQISEVPSNLAKYYPPNYYSYQVAPVPQNGWKALLAGWRDRWVINGRFPESIYGTVFDVRPELGCLTQLGLRPEDKILDVGCGRGQLLSILHRAGFKNLMGIDPYLDRDIEVVPGLIVRKMEAEMISDLYDLIMMHHVFEHIAEGEAILRVLKSKLNPGGRLLLRIPVADSFAWETYKEHWVQLDAPRHLRLHTRKSLQLLADAAGLAIERIWCDSADFQFWGSELYRKGIPLSGTATTLHFTPQEMAFFKQEAKRMNSIQRGDQIAAILTAR